MTARRRLKVNIGKQRLGTTKNPSDEGYFIEMQRASKQMTDQLLNIIDQFENVSEDICIEALQPTFEKAKYYTPKDTHALVNSAYLEKVGFRGKPRVEMGFARGGHPHYAAIVHENLSMLHEAPTRAKFLESALKEDMSDILVRLGALYKSFMNGGG